MSRDAISFAITVTCAWAVLWSNIANGTDEPKPVDRKQISESLSLASKYLTWDVAKEPPGELALKSSFAFAKLSDGLPRLSEADELRLEAIALARKYSSVTDLMRPAPKGEKRDANYHHQAHAGLYFSWNILQGTKVLREGLSLEEAVALLGSPTAIKGDAVEWYYNSEMHVNPCLRCMLSKGRIQSIKQIKR